MQWNSKHGSVRTKLVRDKMTKKEWLQERPQCVKDIPLHHMRQTSVCVCSCVLFEIAGGRWGVQAEWWNICREKQSTSCLRLAAFAQAASWVSDQLGQVELEKWQEHKTEGKAEQSVIHLHRLQLWGVTKTSAGFVKTKGGSGSASVKVDRVTVSAAGDGAVCLHGPSSCSGALSKHGPPSLGYDCNIIIELISQIPVAYISMPISPLCHSCTCSSCG